MSVDEARRSIGIRQDTEEVVQLLPALRVFARTFYSDPSDADDLVQDTLMKALASIENYQHGTRLKSWLFTIMRNAFYNRIVVARRDAPGAIDCIGV